MNAPGYAVRWAHRRHRNAHRMDMALEQHSAHIPCVTVPESDNLCSVQIYRAVYPQNPEQSCTHGAKVDLLALPPWQAHYGLKW